MRSLLPTVTVMAACALVGCPSAKVSPSDGRGARPGVAAPRDGAVPAATVVAPAAAPVKGGTFTVPYAVQRLTAGHAITLQLDERTIVLRTGTVRYVNDEGWRVTLTSADALPDRDRDLLDDELARIADAVVRFTIPIPTALPAALGDRFTFLSGMPMAADVVIGLRELTPGLASPYDFFTVPRDGVRIRATNEQQFVVDVSIDGATLNPQIARVIARGSLGITAASPSNDALQIVDLTTRVSNDAPVLATAERSTALPYALLQVSPTSGTGRLSLSSVPLSCNDAPFTKPSGDGIRVDLYGAGIDLCAAGRFVDVSSTPQPVRAVEDSGRVAPRGWIAFDDLSTKDGSLVHGHLALATPTPWFAWLARTPLRSPVTLAGTFVATVCAQ